MPKPNRTVSVSAVHGELMVYRVESWGRPDIYHTVDLLEFDGNGECDCKDFIKCRSNMKAGHSKVMYGYPGLPDPDRTQCRHIYCARIKFTNDTLATLSRQQNEQPSR
jgi:hypothetical protein